MTRSEDTHNALDSALRHGVDVETAFVLVDIVKDAIVNGCVDHDDTLTEIEDRAAQSGFDLDETLFVTEVAEALGYVW